MAQEIETPTSTTASGSENPPNPSSSSKSDPKQLPPFYGFAAPNGELPMFPIMYPTLVPGIYPPQQGQEQMDHGAGIYAVPTFPNSFMGPIAGFPSNHLIPFTYNVPTGPSPSEAGTGGEEQGQVGQQQQQQGGQQRQVVVRRFQIAIHLDLLLILKLAAVIFLFNQDGSRKRLVLLIFFASLIYLYQTGALAPLIRWLSQGMQRAAAPPQQPRPAARADNAPAAARQENENAPLVADGEGAAENENRVAGDVNQGENEREHGGELNGNNRWWGIVKEIQLIVFGFITSLLPGFHNID
ncbi:uncharacterized protein LOC112529379 isoform X2 [Cynara cardunculus var. scolymus]|uniref:uncharacterized protein LOC112529379 isoform X2 n=1 Tax=Cynara cardunculus var. scolymus TaxID=59895 RepID=UPI000D628852|nr:uncharacterized protein LOC112529379 isoform X2 [Cynara cardunculus var. scolymus]